MANALLRLVSVWVLGLGISLFGACDDENAAVADADAEAPVFDGGDARSYPVDTADANVGNADADVGNADANVDNADALEGERDVPGPIAAAGKLDLVFMVDNSSSMREEQDSLRAAFPALIKSLEARPGGLPDLRIGIISSNLGAGPTAANSACPVGGDRGRFLVRTACGLVPGSGNFIRVDANGGTNVAAGVAGLADAFKCLAELGTGGCGYEHQLGSLYQALGSAVVDANAGFLRDDAVLGIIMLSDEDDCSGSSNEADFYEGLIPGQAGSVRCSLRGHMCGGQAVPAMPFTWPLNDCKPYQRDDVTEAKSRLINVSFFSDFILNSVRKGRGDQIFVATIIGWDEAPSATYRIVTGANGDIDTGEICRTPATGGAAPGIRLHAFARAFPHHAVYSICTPDLRVPLTEIGTKLLSLLPPAR